VGTLAAVGLGFVLVLAIAIVTFRTLDAPATAQADPAHPQTAHPQGSQPTRSQPTGAQPTGTQPTGAQPTGAQPTGANADAVAWTRTLEALDVQRARAFWTLDLSALDRIYVPGSSPWRSDHALLSGYRDQQIRVEGLRVAIDSSTIAHRTPTTVTLRTTDHLAAGHAVDQTGARTPLPPGTPTTKLITLTTDSTTKAWRITAITQA
jgi:hypothetical protein